MQENNKTTNIATPEEEGFNIGSIFALFMEHWKLFAASVFVCMLGAGFFLYNAVPRYQVSAKILLSDKEKGSFSSQADMLVDFGFQGNNTNVENEIEVINSMSVARGAVLESGVYTSYAIPAFNDRPIYKTSSPVSVSIDTDTLQSLSNPLTMHFTFHEEQPATVEYEHFSKETLKLIEYPAVTINEYPFVLSTVAGDILIESNVDSLNFDGELKVVISPIESVARSYMARLGIAPVSKTSSVAVLTMNTPVPAEGIDYLNAVIKSYNDVTNEDKRQVARKTEDFITDRIDSLNIELKAMEMRLARYKKDNQLIDPSLDAAAVSKSKAEYIKQLEEADVKLEAAKHLNKFINDPANDKKIIPSTFGVTIDPSLVALLNNYNKEVLERNQLLLTANTENPILKASTERVEIMQKDLRIALAEIEKSLNVQRNAIALLVESYSTRFAMSPDIERELLSLKRECDVKSGLYVMLLQKYEENALSLAVTADNLRCIDAPAYVGQTAPNKKMIIIFALLLGVAIPAAYVYIMSLVNTEIKTTEEIQNMLNIPHVGTIPFKEGLKSRSAAIVVDRNSSSIIGEAFRSLRTNMQFVMKKSQGKVVMFTSTTSGEGKTFIASNLALSTALLGKKVLLMGLDIRRPRLAEMFGFNPNDEGFTSYLAADYTQVQMLDKFIKKSGIVEGFDILPAGITPPNPAELLSRRNLDKAIEYLSEKYDSIILDAAPVGLVTDSMIASRVADAVVYVARLNYTHREDLEFLKSLITEGKFENISVVINGEKLNSPLYGSRKYGRYGSRYAGYGYTYSDSKKK